MASKRKSTIPCMIPVKTLHLQDEKGQEGSMSDCMTSDPIKDSGFSSAEGARGHRSQDVGESAGPEACDAQQQGGTYTCRPCSFESHDLNLFLDHVYSSHPDFRAEPSFYCVDCGISAAKFEGLALHNARTHPSTADTILQVKKRDRRLTVEQSLVVNEGTKETEISITKTPIMRMLKGKSEPKRIVVSHGTDELDSAGNKEVDPPAVTHVPTIVHNGAAAKATLTTALQIMNGSGALPLLKSGASQVQNRAHHQQSASIITPSTASSKNLPKVMIPLSSIPTYDAAMDNSSFLKTSFSKFPYPTKAELCYLTVVTKYPEEQIKIWFTAQRLKQGISWSPEEIEDARRKMFNTIIQTPSTVPQQMQQRQSHHNPPQHTITVLPASLGAGNIPHILQGSLVGQGGVIVTQPMVANGIQVNNAPVALAVTPKAQMTAKPLTQAKPTAALVADKGVSMVIGSVGSSSSSSGSTGSSSTGGSSTVITISSSSTSSSTTSSISATSSSKVTTNIPTISRSSTSSSNTRDTSVISLSGSSKTNKSDKGTRSERSNRSVGNFSGSRADRSGNKVSECSSKSIANDRSSSKKSDGTPSKGDDGSNTDNSSNTNTEDGCSKDKYKDNDNSGVCDKSGDDSEATNINSNDDKNTGTTCNSSNDNKSNTDDDLSSSEAKGLDTLSPNLGASQSSRTLPSSFLDPSFYKNKKSQEQLSVLKESFNNCQFPNQEEVERLTKITGLTIREVRKWFSDRRYHNRNLKGSRSSTGGLFSGNSVLDLTESPISKESPKTSQSPQRQTSPSTPSRRVTRQQIPDFTAVRYKERDPMQVRALETSFSENPLPSVEEVDRLRAETKMTRREIDGWFSERRKKVAAEKKKEEAEKAEKDEDDVCPLVEDKEDCKMKDKDSESPTSTHEMCEEKQKDDSPGAEPKVNPIKINLKMLKVTESNGKLDSEAGLPAQAESPRLLPQSGPTRGKKTPDQLHLLKQAFARTHWPSSSLYDELLTKTGLPRPEVVRWFGDCRYVFKNGQLKWLESYQQMVDEEDFQGSDTTILQDHLDDHGKLDEEHLKKLVESSKLSEELVKRWFARRATREGKGTEEPLSTQEKPKHGVSKEKGSRSAECPKGENPQTSVEVSPANIKQRTD